MKAVEFAPPMSSQGPRQLFGMAHRTGSYSVWPIEETVQAEKYDETFPQQSK